MTIRRGDRQRALSCDRSVDVSIIHMALAAVRPVFALDLSDGVHGLPHWSRVWGHGRRLAASEGVNPAVLAWFAFLHDSRRRNDGWDPGHGNRAADFAVRLRNQGVLTELAPGEFEELCEAMRLHSDGHTDASPAMRCCWDADRLDLGRVGTRPDPSRLCTDMARRKEVIESAWAWSRRCRMALVHGSDRRAKMPPGP